jgi:signal transduction histidine kinase
VLLEDLEISVPEMPETGTEFFNLAAEKSDSPEKFKSTIFNIDNETKGLLLEEITVNRKFFEIYTAPTQANLETPAGRIWYFRNITIHKKAAEAMEKAKTEVEKASEMRNRFFAVVSHDVKAPLSSIKGFSNLIKKNPNDKSVTEYLDIIDDSCDHLLALINDILDLTKIEQEKMDFHIQRFILTDLIKNCASSFSPQAEKKNIRINYSISDGLPEVIEGDLNRVKQIINNLLGNALKFTYEGSIDILVTKAEKPAFIRIDIRDTGIGMEKEKVKYIFNPFSQAGAEINSEFGGHGLGLAIAKNLVEKFGGEISAVSSPGEGSTFSFTIPCELKESF